MSSAKSLPPQEFFNVMRDFVADLKRTFPELEPTIHKWWKEPSDFDHIADEVERDAAFNAARAVSVQFLFNFCKNKYPGHLMQLMNQSESLFSDGDSEFLPHICFKQLWNMEDISTNIKEAMWKYMQLILFSIIQSATDTTTGAESSEKAAPNNNMEDDILREFRESMTGLGADGMTQFFENARRRAESECAAEGDLKKTAGSAASQMESMLGNGGKLGKLAHTLAENTLENLNIDETASPNDQMKALFSNSNLMKNLISEGATSIENMMKSGDLTSEDLMAEVTGLMSGFGKMTKSAGSGDEDDDDESDSSAPSMPGMADLMKMMQMMGGASGKGSARKSTSRQKRRQYGKRANR